MSLRHFIRHRLPEILLFATLLISFVLLANSAQSQTGAQDLEGQSNPRIWLPFISAGSDSNIKGPILSSPVKPNVFTGNLADLPGMTAPPVDQPARLGYFFAPQEQTAGTGAGSTDPVLQATAGAWRANGALSDPILNYNGIATGSNPHDPVGDVGPNHYIQMVNSQFQIYDKQGNPLLTSGPININCLWRATSDCSLPPPDGINDLCEQNNAGDPIVLYDEMADRWLVSQFTGRGNNDECIAISRTADPVAGGWYLYAFDLGQFNDYPKLGVWPDAYYMGTNLANNVGAYAFDRANMLNGNPATFIQFTVPGLPGLNGNVMLPSDLDGGTPPPDDSPNYFYRQVDADVFGGANDRVEVFDFDVNWGNPAASTFTGPLNITMAPFESDLCGFFSFMCIPQPGGATTLDPLNEWPMWRLQYRNLGSHEAMVSNFVVDVDGSDNAGIRWFELRKSGAGAWSLFQQGTYAPQFPGSTSFEHRWMGSIAMDKEGNIALGYSVSNSTDVSPSIRYTGRLAGDPLGLLPQGEITLVNGQATINNSRWGDYSSLNVDPVDGCTFWLTNDFVATAGARRTRIGTFRFPTCRNADLSISKSASPDPVSAGESLTYEITVVNNGPSDATSVVVTDTLPLGVVYDVDTDSCTLSMGTGDHGEDQLVCDLGDIAAGDSSTFAILATVGSDLAVGGSTTITNTAEVASAEEDPDLTNNIVTVVTIVNALADLRVTKECKPDRPVAAGDEAVCTIWIENLGPSTASNVVAVDEHVSDGSFFFGNVTPDPECGETPNPQNGAGTVTCNMGNIAPGNTITITVPEGSNEWIDINDHVTVSSDTDDPDPSNNQDEDHVEVRPMADLAISKSDFPDPVVAGTLLTYTLTITNNGPSAAEDVRVEDVLPAGVTIITVDASPAGVCAPGTPGSAAHPTVCVFGNLADTDVATVTIVVLVHEDTAGPLHNSAQVFSDNHDPNMVDNFASTTTTVGDSADLSITKSDSPDPVNAGDELTYEITITNNGPSDAADVAMLDTLPAEVTFLDATISNGSGSCVLLVAPPNTVSCDLGTLSSGSFVTIFITVLVDPATPDGTVLSNTATVSSATGDPVPGNNTAVEQTLVQAESDVEILKDGSVDVTNPAPLVTYDIDVINHGPSDALNVVFTDTLPLTPKKVVYTFDTGNGACAYDEAAHIVTCDLGTVEAGESVEILIYVEIRGSVGVISNFVTVTTTTFDPDLENNTARKDLLIHG